MIKFLIEQDQAAAIIEILKGQADDLRVMSNDVKTSNALRRAYAAEATKVKALYETLQDSYQIQFKPTPGSALSKASEIAKSR